MAAFNGQDEQRPSASGSRTQDSLAVAKVDFEPELEEVGPWDVLDSAALFLKKFAEIAIFATLIAVPFFYHFRFDDHLGQALRNLFAAGGEGATRFFDHEVLIYITALMPILESKFATWFVLGIFVFGAYVPLILMESLTGRSLLHNKNENTQTNSSPIRRYLPFACIIGFLTLSLASMLLWPPRIPPETLMSITTRGNTGFEFGGGGFFFSSVALLQTAFGIVFLLVCQDLIRSRVVVTKIAGIMVLVGFLNALVVILLKVDFKPLSMVWIDFPATESRNNLGGFIGHNTGVSSFLMAPIILTSMWLFSLQPRKNQGFRLMMVMVFVVMTLALVLAQSRAVFPIVLLSIFSLVFLLWKKACLVTKSRLYIWMPVLVVFVILTQIIPGKFNLLYREDVTFVERVQEFRPQRLITETRLRILTVAMSELIPSSPIIGHGFGSFQYVYPKAQGDYFLENPNSSLVPTRNRTMRAHNEYLQILIETGLLGLALVLTALFTVLANGWAAMQRTLMPHHIAMQAGIFFSIVAILIHCLIDFPLRVPPICLYLVVLLSIWGAGRRLWVFPVRAPINQMEAAFELEADAPQSNAPLRNVPAPVTAVLMISLMGLSLAVLVGVTATSVGRFITASVYYTKGRSFAQMALFNPQMLERAWTESYKAKRVFWISGDINYNTATVQYQDARTILNYANQLADQGHFEEAAKHRDYGIAKAQAALSDITMAFTDVRHHHLYQLKAYIYFTLERNATGSDKQFYQRQGMDALYSAVSMNPGDVDALYQLINILEPQSATMRSELIRLHRLMKHFHPKEYEERVFGRAMDAMAISEYRDAYERLRLIVEAVPNNPVYLITWAQVNIETGRNDVGRNVLTSLYELEMSEKMLQDINEARTFLQLQIAVNEGNFESVLSRLNRPDRFRPSVKGQLDAARYLTMRKTNASAAEIELARQEIFKLAEGDPINLQIAGAYAFKMFQDWEEAIFWLEEKAAISEPPMDFQGYVLLAKAYIQVGRMEDALELRQPILNAAAAGYQKEMANRIVREIETRAGKVSVEMEGE